MTTPLAELYLKACEFDRYKRIVEEWKSYWMNQTQNSKADYDNYWRRAFGVDANMQYSLADKLTKDRKPLDAKVADLIRQVSPAVMLWKSAQVGYSPTMLAQLELTMHHMEEALSALAEEVKGGK